MAQSVYQNYRNGYLLHLIASETKEIIKIDQFKVSSRFDHIVVLFSIDNKHYFIIFDSIMKDSKDSVMSISKLNRFWSRLLRGKANRLSNTLYLQSDIPFESIEFSSYNDILCYESLLNMNKFIYLFSYNERTATWFLKYKFCVPLIDPTSIPSHISIHTVNNDEMQLQWCETNHCNNQIYLHMSFLSGSASNVVASHPVSVPLALTLDTDTNNIHITTSQRVLQVLSQSTTSNIYTLSIDDAETLFIHALNPKSGRLSSYQYDLPTYINDTNHTPSSSHHSSSLSIHGSVIDDVIYVSYRSILLRFLHRDDCLHRDSTYNCLHTSPYYTSDTIPPTTEHTCDSDGVYIQDILALDKENLLLLTSDRQIHWVTCTTHLKHAVRLSLYPTLQRDLDILEVIAFANNWRQSSQNSSLSAHTGRETSPRDNQMQPSSYHIGDRFTTDTEGAMVLLDSITIPSSASKSTPSSLLSFWSVYDTSSPPVKASTTNTANGISSTDIKRGVKRLSVGVYDSHRVYTIGARFELQEALPTLFTSIPSSSNRASTSTEPKSYTGRVEVGVDDSRRTARSHAALKVIDLPTALASLSLVTWTKILSAHPSQPPLTTADIDEKRGVEGINIDLLTSLLSQLITASNGLDLESNILPSTVVGTSAINGEHSTASVYDRLLQYIQQHHPDSTFSYSSQSSTNQQPYNGIYRPDNTSLPHIQRLLTELSLKTVIEVIPTSLLEECRKMDIESNDALLVRWLDVYFSDISDLSVGHSEEGGDLTGVDGEIEDTGVIVLSVTREPSVFFSTSTLTTTDTHIDESESTPHSHRSATHGTSVDLMQLSRVISSCSPTNNPTVNASGEGEGNSSGSNVQGLYYTLDGLYIDHNYDLEDDSDADSGSRISDLKPTTPIINTSNIHSDGHNSDSSTKELHKSAHLEPTIHINISNPMLLEQYYLHLFYTHPTHIYDSIISLMCILHQRIRQTLSPIVDLAVREEIQVCDNMHVHIYTFTDVYVYAYVVYRYTQEIQIYTYTCVYLCQFLYSVRKNL